MIHYHGTPITPRDRLFELAGRHFCVSFAEPRDVHVCHEIGQSVMLDNGAFSFWNDKRREHPGWDVWAAWAEMWLSYPTTWAVLPDVIDGTVQENAALIERYRTLPRTVPVWHLHEPLLWLEELCRDFERVCFGSSGAYRDVGSPHWHRRIAEAFDIIADADGRVPWIHMLRGLALAGSHYPFASADSTNAARNHAGSHRQRSRPIAAMVAEIDARQCPARWARVGVQERIPVIDDPDEFCPTDPDNRYGGRCAA